MRHWFFPVFLAVCLHLCLGVLLYLADNKPKEKSTKQIPAVKSYLVFSAPEPKRKPEPENLREIAEPEDSFEPEVMPKLEEELLSPAELTDTLPPESQPVVEQPSTDIPPETLNIEVAETDVEQSTPTASNQELSEGDSPNIDLSVATERYLQSQLTRNFPVSRPPTPPFNQNNKERRHKAIKPFLPQIGGSREIAVSADGSRLVQHAGNCFNIQENEFRDQVWTPTPCPNSADRNRQQLRDSLKKFGIGQ